MTDDDRLQFEMACSGCISGTLAEWPALDTAFREHGIDLHHSTRANTLSQISRLMLEVDAITTPKFKAIGQEFLRRMKLGEFDAD